MQVIKRKAYISYATSLSDYLPIATYLRISEIMSLTVRRKKMSLENKHVNKISIFETK